jgi:hypothetical protein
LWFLALTFATAASLPPAADAQDPPPAAAAGTSAPASLNGTPAAGPASAGAPPAPASAATTAGAADPDAKFAYRVVIAAPDDIAAPVRSAVDLVRWQGFSDMTEDLFDRLARDALAQAREAAATQGYFSAEVELTVDRATRPATATLKITPGPGTRITEVTIDVTGPARDQPPGPAVLANIRDEWL